MHSCYLKKNYFKKDFRFITKESRTNLVYDAVLKAWRVLAYNESTIWKFKTLERLHHTIGGSTMYQQPISVLDSTHAALLCAYLMFLPKICFASFRSSTKYRSRSSARCRKQREAFFNLKHTMAFHWVRLVLRGLHHLLDNISLTMGSRQGNQEEKNACYTYIHPLRSNLQWNRKH